MARVAPLVRPGGLMALSLRHGPVPAGRRMFECHGRSRRARWRSATASTPSSKAEGASLLGGPAVWWEPARLPGSEVAGDLGRLKPIVVQPVHVADRRLGQRRPA